MYRRFERIPRSKMEDTAKDKEKKKSKGKRDTKELKEELESSEKTKTESDVEIDEVQEVVTEPPEAEEAAQEVSEEKSKKKESTADEPRPELEQAPELQLEPEPEPEQVTERKPETELELEAKPEPEQVTERKPETEPESEETDETKPAKGEEIKADESETKVTDELADDGDELEKETAEIEEVTGEEQPEGEAKEAKEQPIVPTEVEGTTVEPEEGEVAETPKESDIFLGTDLSEFTDFFPTRDTITVITHLDVDGVLCLAAIYQMINSKQADEKGEEDNSKVRVFFTSPIKTFSALSKSIPDINKLPEDEFSIGDLYICDLSLNRDTLLGSTIYDNIKWFDHHEVDPTEQYDSDIENIELILDPSADSTTSIICDYFKIKNEFTKFANEIDTNEIKSRKAKRIRDIIGGLRLKYYGSKLKKALTKFAQELSKDLNVINDKSFNPIIDDFKKWVTDFNKYSTERIQSHTINGRKVGILEVENTAPVYAIYENLKAHPNGPFDVLAVMIQKYDRIGKDKNNKFKNKKYTKIEFRTHTDLEIHELAKIFGGGGHKFASGATVIDGLNDQELLKTIESFFSSS